MIRRVPLLLAAALSLASIAAVPLRTPSPSRSAVTLAAVDLRAAASPRAAVLTRIPKARTVRVQACAREWCTVTYRRRQGFVPQGVLRERERRVAGAACGRAHYRNRKGQCIRTPAPPADGRPPLNSTVRCWDGEYSFGTDHRGRCSGHGGTADAGSVSYAADRLYASAVAMLPGHH
jgi:Protein of unknown function (DUF3761)/Bacterial SH3 domain